MQQPTNGLRIFSIFVLAFFILGVLFLVWNTLSKDNSINPSSADSSPVVCGNADTNQNGVLDSIDYNLLKDLLNSKCIDTPAQTYCGPKDMNADGVIDVKDISEFAKRFNKPNCGL